MSFSKYRFCGFCFFNFERSEKQGSAEGMVLIPSPWKGAGQGSAEGMVLIPSPWKGAGQGS